MHFCQDAALLKEKLHLFEALVEVFELILDGNELWVHATFENHEVEKFHVQTFNEGAEGEGSQQYQFVKKLFKDPHEININYFIHICCNQQYLI